jgi:uncharacterized protein
VILVDANLLIYAHNEGVTQHEAAQKWLAKVLIGDEDLGLPWAVIHTFLRLTTGGRVFRETLPIERSLRIVDRWLAVPHVKIVEPGPRYWDILRRLCIDSAVRGKVLSDAHLAAIAVEHDATMCTTDADFRRFAGLRVFNPLA